MLGALPINLYRKFFLIVLLCGSAHSFLAMHLSVVHAPNWMPP